MLPEFAASAIVSLSTLLADALKSTIVVSYEAKQLCHPSTSV
jgi:hypothetical protein